MKKFIIFFITTNFVKNLKILCESIPLEAKHFVGKSIESDKIA